MLLTSSFLKVLGGSSSQTLILEDLKAPLAQVALPTRTNLKLHCLTSDCTYRKREATP